MRNIIEFELDRSLMLELEEVAKIKMKQKSELAREALVDFIRRETSLADIRKLTAKKFSSGKLSFDEMVKLLGYDDARKIAFFTEIAEKSFKKGLG